MQKYFHMLNHINEFVFLMHMQGSVLKIPICHDSETVSSHNNKTLKLKQLHGIQLSIILLYTFAIFLQVKMSSVKKASFYNWPFHLDIEMKNKE